MTQDFTIDKNFIIINQKDYSKFKMYMAWAEQNPELFQVFSAGILKCKTEYASTWFMLRWS